MPEKYLHGIAEIKTLSLLFLGMTGAAVGWVEKHMSDLIKIGLLIGGFIYSMNLTLHENSMLIRGLQVNQERIVVNQEKIAASLDRISAESIHASSRLAVMEKLFYRHERMSIEERAKNED